MLARLVDVYRGVFLYGDSGTGKSSLVNAGLLPQARKLGFDPVRVRVQPREGEEIVVEPIATSDDETAVLTTVLAPEADGSARVTLSIAEFEARVRAASREHQPLIVFDQFEEILTQFEDHGASRRALAEMIVRLLREALPVKLLFAFREDHLGRVKQLLRARPELVDQALRLGPPPADALGTIIRGPFHRHPGHFERELAPDLAARLQAALAERFGTGEVSLSEVQTVCLRLWRSPDPAALLAQKGVQGLLEDELGEALDALAPDLRGAAIAVLSRMVTAAGTRNVVSAEDLRQRVRDDDDGIAPALVDEALAVLERESKLIRRERRRDIYLYEITSEFLAPWISLRRDELRLAQERRRGRRRLRIVVAIAGGLVLLAAVVAAVVLGQRAETQREARNATSLALAASSVEPLTSRPDVSLALAFEAYRTAPRPEASAAVNRALIEVRRSRLRGAFRVGDVSDVAFSPDGKILATVGRDASIRLWDPLGHGLLGRLGGNRELASLVAFSPDGKTIAAAGADRTLRLWDAESHRRIGDTIVHEGGINAIAFSPDARTIATAGNQDGTVRLWDAVSTRAVGTLAVHGDTANGVQFSPDGTIVATAGDEDVVRLWDAATHKPVGRLGRGTRRVRALAFSPDGKTLATASLDEHAVRLWDLDTRAEVGRLEGRTLFWVVAFSPDGSTIATVANEDSAVVLWDAATRKQTARLSGHVGPVIAVAFDRVAETLATAGIDGTVRLWDLAARARPGPLKGHGTPIHAVAFSRDGRTLVAAGEDGGFELWDPARRKEVRRIAGTNGGVFAAAFSPDRRTAATVDVVGMVRLRDLAGGKQRDLLRTGEQFFAVAFSPDGETLATAGADHGVRLWDPVSGRHAGRLPAFAASASVIAFSPDGKTLATAGDGKAVRLWDPVRGRQIGRLEGSAGSVLVIAFSADGKTVAAGGADRAVRLWDRDTAKQVGRLTGHTGPVSAIAFTPDAKTLASASYEEHAVRVWDLATRKQVGPLSGHTGPIYGLAFSPDGTTLASAGADKTVRLWTDVFWHDEARLHASVCSVLRSGISRSDWALFAPGIAYRRSCP